MLSKLQKLLYNMSMFSPFFLIWVVWIVYKTVFSMFVVLSISFNVSLIVWYYLFFIGKQVKSMQKETIKVESFCPSAIKMFDLALQVFPIIIGFFSTVSGVVIYVLMILYMTKSNLNFVSPLLFFHKSNLYEITIKDSGCTCLLATKKEVKNANEVKEAKYIFPYFYVDE